MAQAQGCALARGRPESRLACSLSACVGDVLEVGPEAGRENMTFARERTGGPATVSPQAVSRWPRRPLQPGMAATRSHHVVLPAAQGDGTATGDSAGAPGQYSCKMAVAASAGMAVVPWLLQPLRARWAPPTWSLSCYTAVFLQIISDGLLMYYVFLPAIVQALQF